MRVGMIGFGAIGRVHLKAWRALGVEPCIYDPVPRAREEAAAAGVAVHDHLDELFEAVDTVDLCTPSDSHADLVRTAARAGRHVICEKPLALTLDDAIDAVRVATSAGVQLHVGHVVRFYGAYIAAHDALVSGRIGVPAVLHFRRAGVQPSSNGWMQLEERSGGLALDLMIHDLDQARWMAGDVVRVFAQSARPGAGDVNTHMYAILTHASGAISHITSSWALASGWDTSFEIAGSEGMVSYDSNKAVSMRADKPELLSIRPIATSPFVDELREFCESISTGMPSRVTAADAVSALALALAVRKSVATGAPVEIPALPHDVYADQGA